MFILDSIQFAGCVIQIISYVSSLYFAFLGLAARQVSVKIIFSSRRDLIQSKSLSLFGSKAKLKSQDSDATFSSRFACA